EIPEMTCAACRELLPWQIAGTLAPGERAAVERHQTDCPACQREADLWRAVAAALADDERAIPSDHSDGDAEAGWQALRQRLEPRGPMVVTQQRLLQREAAAGQTAPLDVRPPRWGRPTLAAPAIVVLVALIAALFIGFGARLRQARTPAVSATATPISCAPDALRATIPAHGLLSELSMTSPRAGWAVGAIVTGSDLTTPTYQTLVLGFQQCQWAPVGASIASAELESVSMASATDGWAVGVTNPGANDSALLALQHTGGAWQRVSVPAAPSGVVGAKVRMTTAGDGWMLLDLGGRHVTPYQKQYSYVLLHYQGGVWSPTPLSFDPSGELILWGIAANSPDDCWIDGYAGGVGNDFAVAHYHKGKWTTWSDQQLGVSAPALYAIVAPAPNDVWVAGSYGYQDANGDHSGPLVLHYDGAKWTRASVGDLQGESGDHSIMALAANGSGEVWGFTQAFGGGQAYIAHEVNGAWTWTPGTPPVHGAWTSASTPSPVVRIGPAVFVSGNEAFAPATVAQQRTLGGAILRYANGAWSVLPGA
ncbi:MAG: zf-HC2 domain-containing protein, partial [Ktedonobacterales bacterium]